MATPSDLPGTVACGYGFLLAPLPAGEHTVRLTVDNKGDVMVDIRNEITVTKDA